MKKLALLTATLIVSAMAAAQPNHAAPFKHWPIIVPDPFELTKGALTAPVSEQSIQWPILLRNYLWHTGDEAFVRQMMDTHLEDWATRFRKLADANGFLSQHILPQATPEWARNKLLLNALYLRALETTVALQRDLGQHAAFSERVASRTRALLRAAAAAQPELMTQEVLSLLILLGVEPPEAFKPNEIENAIDTLNEPLLPFVAEAAFLSGNPKIGMFLLQKTGLPLPNESGAICTVPSHHAGPGTFHCCTPNAPDATYLIVEYRYGLRPTAPGWRAIQFEPTPGKILSPLEIGVPDGRISIDIQPGLGYVITTPIGAAVQSVAPAGGAIVTKSRLSHTAATLTESQRAILQRAAWTEHTGNNQGIWISGREQVLRLVHNETILFQGRCATALAGLGSEMNSLKTPLGWHEIRGKIGEDAPWGQVFRARRATNEVWQYGEDTTEDLVLTRVLLLDGLEPGLNKGGNVDSMARHIYIHGTNDEAKLGIPSSHGCIRMFNDEVIELFDRVEDGTRVLITAD